MQTIFLKNEYTILPPSRPELLIYFIDFSYSPFDLGLILNHTLTITLKLIL